VPVTQNLPSEATPASQPGGMPSVVAVAPSESDADRLAFLRDCAIAESYVRFCRAFAHPIRLAIPAAPAHDDADAAERSTTEIAWWQQRFLELLARQAVSPPDSPSEPWTLATETTNAKSLAELRNLTGWSEPALAAQRDALDHVDGVEIKAATIDGRKLTLFVPGTDKPEQGRLALISPRHPGVRDWLTPDVTPIDEGDATGLIAGVVRPTGAFLRIDGLPRAVPLVVSDGVQDHFGPTAVLVSPTTPNVDGDLVTQLSESAPVWGGSQKRVRSRNSARFRTPSVPISGARSVSDVPVPVVWCDSCGVVPVPADMLPIQHDGPTRIACPSCGANAARDGHALVFGPGGRLPWLAAETSGEAMLITGPHGRDTTLADRAMARTLSDLAPSRVRNGEPYSVNLATGAIAGEVPASDIDDEALRFALLYAAAPATSFTWQAVDHEQCAQFLDHLGEYAIPRLTAATGALLFEAIDDSAPRRRKLIAWCNTARQRITENMTTLQTHRATRNTMILLDRIKAFEQRSAELAPDNAADAAAIASALALLVRLAEPLAPQTMSAIWESAGGEGSLSELPWPS
jgi:hypothetical protein